MNTNSGACCVLRHGQQRVSSRNDFQMKHSDRNPHRANICLSCSRELARASDDRTRDAPATLCARLSLSLSTCSRRCVVVVSLRSHILLSAYDFPAYRCIRAREDRNIGIPLLPFSISPHTFIYSKDPIR